MINHPEVAQYLKTMPWVDLGPACFCVAIKEGGSPILHYDKQDADWIPTWTMGLGNFKSADMLFPQLKLRVPYGPGQALAALTNALVHGAGPFSGRRVALTMFISRNLVRHL